MSERSTYERAFLQVMNLWAKDDTCRQFSFGKRLARVAAELMGVKGVLASTTTRRFIRKRAAVLPRGTQISTTGR